ncbi:AMP-binding protein [Amycolatopsis pithecellobii]|uniref:AMP-binding protein n=1 Tax=Amycolatopsis pithecellobii TaxID=664692 RepID=A0A6N7Z729_9PSEU|nr:AMP-binding protein [Amycolatopsis pithecellobii]MTD55556.1 AMP-binding protein [Amycolatopsis pithecellobii]
MAVTLTPAPEYAERYRRAGFWSEELIDGFVSARAAHPVTAARPAIVDGARTFTFGEVEKHVRAIAGALHELGVRKGDVVSWQLPNWWEAVVLHHGILRCGAVSNPVIPIYRRREVEFILRQAETKVFVHPARFRGFDYRQMVAEMAPQLPALTHTVVVRDEAPSGRAFEELLRAGPAPDIDRAATDPAVLMYTSGTTSAPKGVIHPHATLVRENHGCIESWGLTGTDRIFMPSPLTHVTGLLYGVQLPSMLGSLLVLQDVWEPTEALRLIERHRCSFTAAATPFVHGLVRSEELAQRDVSSLRWVGVGGGDVPPGLVREAEARLGATIARGYGSTEYPTATQAWVDDPLDWRAETDGRPMEGTELKIVDDAGAELPPGERGELLVRGPERFTGYLVPPPGEEVFDADGWFATGDLARLDARGRLTIEGRRKDIVLRGGENISVKEVEDHLYTHPKIAEVAIVAMPDPIMIERACAFVVTAGDEPPTLSELTGYLLDHGFAIQKVPERLEHMAELPKNLAGKVQKFKLRERIEALLAAETTEAKLESLG